MSRLSIYFLAGAAAILFVAKVGRADDMNPIGINIAADAGAESDSPSATEEPEQIDTGTYPTGPAGVVPINNYNNLIITRFKTSDSDSSSHLPPAQAVPSTPIPFALNDDTGASSGASVTAWTGGVSYAVSQTGTSPGFTYTQPDAQLNNGYLGDKSTSAPATVTISNLPNYYVTNGYNVYVYFNANGAAGGKGVISLLQGGTSSAVTGTSSYYVSTEGNGTPAFSGTAHTPGQTFNYIDDSSSTTAGTYTAGDYVNIPVAGASTSSITIQFAYPPTGGSGQQGITAIELVPVGVPEPASLALILLGAVPAAWAIRRRKAA
jgi:hypothetical protein